MMIQRYSFIIIALFLIIPTLVSATSVIVPMGGDVFLGEEGLDIRAAVPPPYDAIAFYSPGSSPGSEMPLDTRRVDTSLFTATPILYQDRIGPWYQWDSRRGTPGSIAFTLREPRVSVRVLQQTNREDVSSGTIPRGSALFIQIDTNIGTVAQRPGFNSAYDGLLDLLISTPGGGIQTSVETKSGGMVSLARITPQESLQTFPALQTGGWDTSATSGTGNFLYSTGLFTVQPRLSFNRVDDNLKSSSQNSLIRGTSFTLGSTHAKITALVDQVTRGSSFSVIISGSPGEPVYFWVDAGSKSGTPGDQPPMILFAQDGVSQDSPEGSYPIGQYQPSAEGGRTIRDLVPHDPYGGVKYYAVITPDRDGKRTVELRTTEQTDDTRYTMKIETPKGVTGPLTDDISVSVQKGSMSVVTAKESYAIGEEVRLSGHNTESCNTYLFITGPNLPSGGARLDQPRQEVLNGVPSSFTIASGDCETWEYRLHTGELGIDGGTYTIYAVPAPMDRNNLGSIPYQVIPLTLKRPYVSLQDQETDVAKGDSLSISGYSSGFERGGITVWIFGKNYFRCDEASVDRDGLFTYEIPMWQTADMVAGQYVVIIQHPMGNGEFDIYTDRLRQMVLGRSPYMGAPIFRVGGPGALMGSDAANALITALNSPYIDDTYTRWDIRVTSPKITINPSSLIQETTSPVVIQGTTNLKAGKRLLIEITDNRFTPTLKGQPDNSYGFSGTVDTMQGFGERRFSLTIPAGRLIPGEYRILVQAIESEVTTSGLLTITSPKPVPTITEEPIANLTPNVTPNLTVTLTPTPVMVQTISVTPVVPSVPPESPVPLSGGQMVPLVAGIVFGMTIGGLIIGIILFPKRKKSDSPGLKEESEYEKEE